MTQKFIITGMTCKSCEAKVSESLEILSEVIRVEASFEKSELVISSTQKLKKATLQQLLPKKYQLLDGESNNHKKNQPTKLRQLTPLFLIFIYLVAATVGMNYASGTTSDAMADFMGLFFIVFSFFKLLDLKGFQPSFSVYDPLAKRFPLYGKTYPFIETALGVMFLTRWHMDIALWATLIVLGVTTVGVTQVLLKKQKIECACLGTALKLPMTEATFIENTLMIAMAMAMLFLA